MSPWERARPVQDQGKGLGVEGRIKGTGEFGVRRRRLVRSNFKMTLGRRTAPRGLRGSGKILRFGGEGEKSFGGNWGELGMHFSSLCINEPLVLQTL